jgi:ribosomal protein L15
MTLDDNSSTKEKNLNIDKLIDDKMVFGKSDIILRVMSSGEIKKQIIVKADEFAVEAVKLILLANSKDVKFEIKEEVKAKV